MKKTKIILSISFVILFLNLQSNTVKCGDIVTTESSYELAWNDEFNESSINTSNWTYDVGGDGWGNNELEYYTDRADNSRIEDDNLVIEAKKEKYNGKNYTSARLKSQGMQEFTYGKIEARIKIPSGKGLWPAFWLLGSSYPSIYWPKCGETDIMEHINLENNIYGTLHWYINDPSCKYHQSYMKYISNIDTTQYHVYSISWDESTIKWYVDDIQYSEVNIKDMDSFHKPFYIILNLAVGGNWPGEPDGSTVFPAKMYIDYVRVYNKTDSNALTSTVKNEWFVDFETKDKYYLDGNGNSINGWVYIKNNWYYFGKYGILQTGWKYIDDNWYYLDDAGIMKTGWINYKEKWYYLFITGEMLKNTNVEGKYELGADGALIN